MVSRYTAMRFGRDNATARDYPLLQIPDDLKDDYARAWAVREKNLHWECAQRIIRLIERIARHEDPTERNRIEQLAKSYAAEATERNPSDCICEYDHASCTYCHSKEPSEGAVKESERLYPAALYIHEVQALVDQKVAAAIRLALGESEPASSNVYSRHPHRSA